MCGYVHMHSAGKHNRRNHDTPAHRPRNHTLYDIPPIRFVFQVTQTDPRSSLMMADYCRNIWEPVNRIRSGTNQCVVLVISSMFKWNIPVAVANAVSINIYNLKKNSLVFSFIYIATSFDPKRGSSSGLMLWDGYECGETKVMRI
jgi:hypothetical protein